VAKTVYLNGRWLSEDQAKVSVFDGGFLHGAGLFETIRVEYGRPFRLESHINRLRTSAEKLLRPLSRETLPPPADVVELVRKNTLDAARVRLTVTAGPMRTDEERDDADLTACMTASPLSGYPPQFYQTGVQVRICSFKQSPDDPTTGHKTTCYLPRLLGLREAHAAKCVEAVWFTTQNELAEGSISNIFLVADGKLATPPLTTPVLPGIARGVVLELAEKLGIAAEERRLCIDDLLDAKECFLTNSIMQVMPVVRVERRDIGLGKPGEVTRSLMEAYRETVRKECSER